MTRKWRVLKETPAVAVPGAESAVYDCIVLIFVDCLFSQYRVQKKCSACCCVYAVLFSCHCLQCCWTTTWAWQTHPEPRQLTRTSCTTVPSVCRPWFWHSADVTGPISLSSSAHLPPACRSITYFFTETWLTLSLGQQYILCVYSFIVQWSVSLCMFHLLFIIITFISISITTTTPVYRPLLENNQLVPEW